MTIFFGIGVLWVQVVLAGLLVVLLYRTTGLCPECGAFIWRGYIDTMGKAASRSPRNRAMASRGVERTVPNRISAAHREVPPVTMRWEQE